MLAESSITLPLTVGMWQSTLPHTHAHAKVHMYNHTCVKVCEESLLIQACWRLCSRCGVVLFSPALPLCRRFLDDFMHHRHFNTIPNKACTCFQVDLFTEWGNCLILIFSLPPLFSIHISVYTQRPGSEERPGHREQHHEDRRLRPGQGCPQHRLL